MFVANAHLSNILTVFCSIHLLKGNAQKKTFFLFCWSVPSFPKHSFAESSLKFYLAPGVNRNCDRVADMIHAENPNSDVSRLESQVFTVFLPRCGVSLMLLPTCSHTGFMLKIATDWRTQPQTCSSGTRPGTKAVRPKLQREAPSVQPLPPFTPK